MANRAYRLWFDRHTRFSWNDDQLTVGVPNRHFEEWLQKTFHDALAGAAREVFGRTLTVRFVIDPQLFQAARREQAEVKGLRKSPFRLAATRRGCAATPELPPAEEARTAPERDTPLAAG